MLREKPKHSLDKSCSYKRPSTCRSRSYAARKPQAFAEHRRIPQSRTGPRQPAALGFACISVPLHGDADAQRRRAASCGKCLRAAQRPEFCRIPSARASQWTGAAGGMPGCRFVRFPCFGQAKEGESRISAKP